MNDLTHDKPHLYSNSITQLSILRRLILALPDDVRTIILEQLDKSMKAIADDTDAFRAFVLSAVEDIGMDVKSMEFELYATKKDLIDERNRSEE